MVVMSIIATQCQWYFVLKKDHSLKLFIDFVLSLNLAIGPFPLVDPNVFISFRM